MYKLVLRSAFLTVKNLAKAFKFRPASASRMLLQFTVQTIYIFLYKQTARVTETAEREQIICHFHMVISLSCRQRSQVNKVFMKSCSLVMQLLKTKLFITDIHFKTY